MTFDSSRIIFRSTWTRVAFSISHWLSVKFTDPSYGDESKIKMRKKKLFATVASQSDVRYVLGRIHEASFFACFLRCRVEIKFTRKFLVAWLIVRRVEDNIQHLLFEIRITIKWGNKHIIIVNTSILLYSALIGYWSRTVHIRVHLWSDDHGIRTHTQNTATCCSTLSACNRLADTVELKEGLLVSSVCCCKDR
jgi:hypothetical protein